jgi:hypothetical protein
LKKILIIIVVLLIGAFILIKLNDNLLLLWNSNKVIVQAESSLYKEKVKIEFGISVNTISRANDSEIFNDRDKYSIIYDGKNENEIFNEYGENDFLITYDNEYYLSFRHFKRNRRHQHQYEFNFKKVDSNIYVEVEINGEDEKRFKRKMLLISNAEKYVRNTPIDSIVENYNMVDLNNGEIQNQIIKNIDEPFNIKMIDDLDFTSGGGVSLKDGNYCDTIKTGFYGNYYIIDRAYSAKTKKPIGNIITVHSPGKMKDWQSNDTTQSIWKIHLKSDIIQVWDSIHVGQSKSEIQKFGNVNKGFCVSKGDAYYYCDFNNYMATFIFMADTLKELTVIRNCK